MKFKVESGCPLFDSLQEIKARGKQCNKIAQQWADANYPQNKGLFLAHGIYAGGLRGLVFDEKPEQWVIVNKEYKIYAPKSKSKIWDEWTELPIVQNSEIKKLLQFQNCIGIVAGEMVLTTSPGFKISDSVILINIPSYYQDYQPVEGMVEILESEWNKLIEQ